MNLNLFIAAIVFALIAWVVAVCGRAEELDTGYRSFGTHIISFIFAVAAIVAAVGAVV